LVEQFTYSFAESTTREISYSQSAEFKKFLTNCIVLCKKRDIENGLTKKELNRRGQVIQSSQNEPQNNRLDPTIPHTGMEFFFSGILVKVYQLPMLFARST
jgi:hypothetical protein